MSGLTSEQKQQYDELGYVHLKGLFGTGELQPLIEELDKEIDRIAQAYHADGLTESLYADEDFETRFMRIVQDSEQAYRGDGGLEIPWARGVQAPEPSGVPQHRGGDRWA